MNQGIYLKLFGVLLFHSIFKTIISNPGSFQTRCVKHSYKTCNSNYTMLPNFYNHQTTEEASIELMQYHPLIRVECSPILKDFLCSLYFPPCNNGNQQGQGSTTYRSKSNLHFMLPCKSACQQVRSGCESLMIKFGFRWPGTLECDQFPNSGEPGELPCDALRIGNETVSQSIDPPPPTYLPGIQTDIQGIADTKNITGTMRECLEDNDCDAKNAFCIRRKCVCKYPELMDHSECHRPQILGGKCISNKQCSMKTPTSACVMGTCACVLPMISYQNLACIQGRNVNEICYNSAQCQTVNVYSFCRFMVPKVIGICVCDQDQFIDYKGSCAPRIGGRCNKIRCPSQIGDVQCLKSEDGFERCACNSNAKLLDGVCVRNKYY